MSTDRPDLTILLVPEGGQASRTFRVSYRKLKVAAAFGALAALLFLTIVGSWLYLAARASRAEQLENRVAQLEEENRRTAAIAQQLAALEAQYEQIRYLFGAGAAETTPELWLPPSGGRGAPAERGSAGEGSNLPSSWPLTDRGFITQALLEGGQGDHPGLDIAVPSGSYVRAAGAGIIQEVGNDSVYGNYVVIDHGGGYRSMYAHASLNLVEKDRSVRQNEVIALSGSSGRSTAPHLHFEILLNGEPVDPLTMVRRR
jgi:murein DD-endopeptidase MepM/ murein hydrolase activator NlpD